MSEPEAYVDRQGDVWTVGDDGYLHTPETMPFPREHVEKKWGPLRPVTPVDDLLAQLADAEQTAQKMSTSCFACIELERMSDRVRPAVEAALDGKIGRRTLSKILIDAGFDIGVRAIDYHRSGHTKRRA